MNNFTHLHLHTQYSILDGATNIKKLFAKVKEYGMEAVAITDHGNMFGTIDFMNEAKNYGIKPIIGCEVYVAANNRFSKAKKEDRSGYHLTLLAKNKEGYYNLSKLVSLGYIEGYYYTPRIDKELLYKYNKGLIVLSGCLGGEVASTIINTHNESHVEKVIKEYQDIFGNNFYLELMRHGIDEQNLVNTTLKKLSSKLNIPLVATNDVHFIDAEDFEAHKILICLNTHKELDENTSFSYTGNEYLRSPQEMLNLFSDIPEAIENSMLIAEQVEIYDIKHDIILPVFPIPEPFKNEDEYLRHLTYEGAKKRYPTITEEIRERIEMELDVIKQTGYAGYFLIVQDFINAAKSMGVLVGPGRGSAAGSVIAYCIGITNIDPIAFNLLFERFLNVERISMPDIDIDFDDVGREEVIKYVINKYGSEKVAQIVTFGTMGAKSAIKDVARVLKLPLSEAERLSKLVPDSPPNISLSQAFEEEPKLLYEKENGSELVKKTLKFASILEGSARQTGIHACGIIIGPNDLINHIPLCLAKDSLTPGSPVMRATQYEGTKVESVGLLKMDFLGLTTLTIIKETLKNIKNRHNVEIDIDTIPLNDPKTLELFQKGETIGLFQFESEGMRAYLKELKPESFEDIVSMNALYRPGPKDFIPLFIDRKLKRKPIEYPHELVENILKPTYGIMVYQEQIMQVAQILGGFTLGKADILRRAMGKKDPEKMAQQKALFVEGAMKKGIPQKKAEEIFEIMLEFAKYGFNRSHSVGYSYLAFQTGYLKAHYPHEYMAAVLTCNLDEIKKITFYTEECKRMGIKVLGPDINESDLKFIVNSQNEIRFGMGAIKGVGEVAAQSIINERNQNGPFKNIFDFVQRINLRTINKKSIETLALAGAFDSFKNTHRAQFFYQEKNENITFIEKLIKYASSYQAKINTSQHNLFGENETKEVNMTNPPMPNCDEWSLLEKLKKEKEVIGFYISGHPLQEYELELKKFCNTSIEQLKKNIKNYTNKEFALAGIITSFDEKLTKNGNRYGTFNIEDYTDNMNITLWLEDFLKWKHFLIPNTFIYLKGKTIIRKLKNDEKIDIKITSMMLLSEVLNKIAKKITLKMSVYELNQETLKKINNLILSTPGNCNISFELEDKNEDIKITLTSNHYLVNGGDFIKNIKKDIPNANFILQ